MRESVEKVLTEALPGVDFSSSNRLFDDGIIDSLALLTIITTLCEHFDIEIDLDGLEAENFNSIESITALVQKCLGSNEK